MHGQETPFSKDNSQLFMVPASVSDRPAAGQRQAGPEPTYPLDPLLALTGLTPDTFAEKVGIGRATAYRRTKDGVKWSEADEWAVAFGYLPYEVWPEWDLADPADWCIIPPDPEPCEGREPTAAA